MDNLRAVIDGLLVADVLDKLDQQVIAGTGVSPEMLGVLNTPGIGSVTMTAGETTAETLLRAIALVQQASGLLTDGIAIAPGAWTALLSVKTAPGGTYLSGAPTAATPTPTLWGLPVVPSAALPANTAIVGMESRRRALPARGLTDRSLDRASRFLHEELGGAPG